MSTATPNRSRRRLHGYSSVRDLFCALADAPGENWREAATDDLAEELLYGGFHDGWRLMTPEDRLRWLIGELWNCISIMPSSTCSDLELPQGSTYAQGVRKLREEILREAGLSGTARLTMKRAISKLHGW